MNRKSRSRYIGPFEVVRRTLNGSYILKELDGSLWSQKVAAFRVLPYITRDDQRLEDLRSNKVLVPPDIELHEQEQLELQEESDNNSDSDLEILEEL